MRFIVKPLILSVFTVMLGLFGLFSIDRHPDTDTGQDLRLHLLVLLIDFLNASTCIAIAAVRLSPAMGAY